MKHGEEETHSVCDARLQKEGGKATCCYCNPHEGCTLATISVEPEVEETVYFDGIPYVRLSSVQKPPKIITPGGDLGAKVNAAYQEATPEVEERCCSNCRTEKGTTPLFMGHLTCPCHATPVHTTWEQFCLQIDAVFNRHLLAEDKIARNIFLSNLNVLLTRAKKEGASHDKCAEDALKYGATRFKEGRTAVVDLAIEKLNQLRGFSDPEISRDTLFEKDEILEMLRSLTEK